MTVRPLSALLGSACVLAGCARPAPPSSADAARVIEANYRRYDDFIVQVNGDSIASLYTPDGEMVGTGVQGPAAIAKFLRGFSNVKVESNNHVTDAITVADSLAIQWGRYRQRAKVGDQPTIDVSGRFAIEWHRMADGRWLIRRLMTLPGPAKD